MSDHTTYKIWTIEDIAKIPAEAMPRFLEELPDIINFVRISARLEVAKVGLSIDHVDWTDDLDHGIKGFKIRVNPEVKEED